MSTSDFSINLEACRFCFRVVNFMSAINESIKIYFKELMREELLENAILPHKCCKACALKLKNFTKLKASIRESENQLLNIFQKDLESEKLFIAEEIRTIKKEPEDTSNFEYATTFFDIGYSANISDQRICVKKETTDLNHTFDRNPQTNLDLKLEKPRKRNLNLNAKPANKIRERSVYMKKLRNRMDYYRCDNCFFKAKHKKKLRRHVVKHIKKEEKKESRYPLTGLYHCDICGFQVRYKKFIIRHMRMHLVKVKKEKFQFDTTQIKDECKICKKMIRRYYMERHLQKIHFKDNELKICEICGLSQKSEARYLYHIRSEHTKIKPFECQYCQQKFYSEYGLRSHLNNMHFNTESICEICSKLCRSKAYLRAHIQCCHEAPRFQCKEPGCEMKFSKKHHLDKHQTKHTNVRSYFCKFCNNCYKSKPSLNVHIYSIHLKTVFSCQVEGCNSSYNRKDFLRGHIKSAHKNLSTIEMEELFQKLRDVPLPSLKDYYDSFENLEKN